MNIAICDDNIKHVNILEQFLSEISKAHSINPEINVYLSGESLTEAYRNNSGKFDVIFLDMEMKKLNGIETANIIRKADEFVIIVFVTSHTEYMRESFKCSPFRFLVKPLDEAELTTVFEDICKKISKKKKVLSFSENKSIVRIYCENILYCESRDHWVYIHTKDETHKICKSLSELHEKLDTSMLYRVHSSYIVNFHYIKAIRNGFIELYNSDAKIPVSRTYRKTVLAEYTDYIERNLYV